MRSHIKAKPSAVVKKVSYIGLPDISGIEVTRKLKKNYPDLEIIIQTIFEDAKTIIESIKAGASGYILKGSPREKIINAFCYNLILQVCADPLVIK
ncbi:response regulator transcription factor [Candidatus Poribacteria bacterium]|nr:response regulator transcription factor [Candidatus Poribacteria bacterium]